MSWGFPVLREILGRMLGRQYLTMTLLVGVGGKILS